MVWYDIWVDYHSISLDCIYLGGSSSSDRQLTVPTEDLEEKRIGGSRPTN